MKGKNKQAYKQQQPAINRTYTTFLMFISSSFASHYSPNSFTRCNYLKYTHFFVFCFVVIQIKKKRARVSITSFKEQKEQSEIFQNIFENNDGFDVKKIIIDKQTPK